MLATTVRTVMTKDVVSVRTFATYKDIARILLEHDISAVPVVDTDHRVQGVVSQADLIEKQAQQIREHAEPRRLAGGHPRRTRSKAHTLSAAALISSPAITVGAAPPNSSAPSTESSKSSITCTRTGMRIRAIGSRSGPPRTDT